MTLTAAEMLAALQAMERHDQTDNRERTPSDGPGEPCIAELDHAWFADRNERLAQRAYWGGAE